MKNSDLQKILRKYPSDMDIKLHIGSENLKDFDNENICDHASDDKISENGNLIKGKKRRVIVINPPIY